MRLPGLSWVALLGAPMAINAVDGHLSTALRQQGSPMALLGKGRRHVAASCSSAGGEPTDYAFSGCLKQPKALGQVKYEGSRQVAADQCFTFCKKKKGAAYFGLGNGRECWCATVHDGLRVSDEACNSPCSGDDKQMCGGVDTASVYVMFDCTPPTQEEIQKEAAEKQGAILSAYAQFKQQTCGQAKENILKVNGAATLVGSVEDCKTACFKGGNSMQCHGFTFEKDVSKCTFHFDVLDGEVKKKKSASCFWKKLA